MESVQEFLQANAAFLVAVIALAISLRANQISSRTFKQSLENKKDADRILLFERRSESVSEVDRQHARIATLMMILAKKIILFREYPSLSDSMPGELERLKSNLESVQVLDEKHEDQRDGIQDIDAGADIARFSDLLANVRALTIRIEKDIAHEQASLEEIRTRIDKAGAA